MDKKERPAGGFILGIVSQFLTSRLSVIMVVASLLLGAAAILVTPREEEPQIVVPMADIYVNVPGASPEEVEQLAATPLERLLWQIDGVEYVYSMSQRDMAIVTVRFYVGEERENSLVKLHNKINMNIDKVAPIIRNWVVKPVEIDDVPIVNVALYSEIYDDHHLRRIGEEVLARLSEVKNISGTSVTSGRRREVRVELIPEKMNGLGVSLLEVYQALCASDASITAGSYSRFNREVSVTSNAFLLSVTDALSLVVGVDNERPIYLRDIARITDGPEEVRNYSRIAFSSLYRKNHNAPEGPLSFPAVTLAISKKKGTNAVTVSRDVIEKIEELKKNIIPHGVEAEIIRNYGETAQEKVNGLLSALAFAIISVVFLLMVALGWREAAVVAMAVPISFSLALFVNFLFGYTINRVTLFALILSLGLVVDDPITNVDNIQRHITRGDSDPFTATLNAVREVLSPVIMSTLAIILCFTPLFFITGMMGPYMAPMAINVPLTVTFSTLSALTIVPWLSHLLLKKLKPEGGLAEVNKKRGSTGKIAAIYRRLVNLFLVSPKRRRGLAAAVVILFIFSGLLGALGFVPLKLLPFDNKNEFQIVIDMPEGTPLEATDRAVRAFEDYLRQVPEVTNTISYTGTSSPMDFNGMVRHYYLRSGSNLADIRINLAPKKRRAMQSHGIVLRLRPDLEKLAHGLQADIKIVEVPPGPPVLSTLVAEIYGTPDKTYDQLIQASKKIKQLMRGEPFVTDIDSSALSPSRRVEITIDREKAALHGVRTNDIIETLGGAVSGMIPAQVHEAGERHPLNVRVILPRIQRSGMIRLSQIPLKSGDGFMIPLAELVTIDTIPEDQPVFHKNLERVVMVTSEMAGRAPAEAVLAMQSKLKKKPVGEGIRINWAGEGEWKITLRVFRDMGLAFAAALLGIYLLLVIQSGSFAMPVLIMMAIPLTLLGIMPGFWLLNLIFGETIGEFYNPVFFTATSMIGMIALGGIVIRNSLVLIEFIEDAVNEGLELKEAVLQSGAMRVRPIVLTALTTAMGATPITFDPVFSGLAWALIFGLCASTLFTLVIIPVTYYAVFHNKSAPAES